MEIKNLFLALCFVVVGINSAVAQTSPSNTTQASGPKKQLSTIIVTGLGGAVLGLSTLSFYGRPQDHLSNIGIGFGVGIIIGTLYTTYQAASSPKTFYSQDGVKEHWRSVTSLTERERWIADQRTISRGESLDWTYVF